MPEKERLPRYVEVYTSGELGLRAMAARKRLERCQLCPRSCKVNRLKGAEGTCQTGRYCSVVSYFAHRGEENCLSGTRGSGTLFFASCNLRCDFCQNFDISRLASADLASAKEVAGKMIYLQRQGCHNINLVTPSHVVPQILEALEIAIPRGLTIPIVYNTSAYDRVETLRLLDGLIDIYMPDLKFTDWRYAGLYTRASDYPEVAKAAIREMHRQVGDLTFDEKGLARRGLLVRHLVMPNGVSSTYDAMNFLVQEISPDTYVNLMSQYHPAGIAHRYPKISRCITAEEFLDALQQSAAAGIHRFDRLDIPFRFTS